MSGEMFNLFDPEGLRADYRDDPRMGAEQRAVLDAVADEDLVAAFEAELRVPFWDQLYRARAGAFSCLLQEVALGDEVLGTVEE